MLRQPKIPKPYSGLIKPTFEVEHAEELQSQLEAMHAALVEGLNTQIEEQRRQMGATAAHEESLQRQLEVGSLW